MDKDEPTHPARFKPEGKQAEKPRAQKQPKGKASDCREAMTSHPHFIHEKPEPPLDSASHDEVVYVGLAGGSPERMLIAMDKMKDSIHQQEALLVEAKKGADHKA